MKWLTIQQTTLAGLNACLLWLEAITDPRKPLAVIRWSLLLAQDWGLKLCESVLCMCVREYNIFSFVSFEWHFISRLFLVCDISTTSIITRAIDKYKVIYTRHAIQLCTQQCNFSPNTTRSPLECGLKKFIYLQLWPKPCSKEHSGLQRQYTGEALKVY